MPLPEQVASNLLGLGFAHRRSSQEGARQIMQLGVDSNTTPVLHVVENTINHLEEESALNKALFTLVIQAKKPPPMLLHTTSLSSPREVEKPGCHLLDLIAEGEVLQGVLRVSLAAEPALAPHLESAVSGPPIQEGGENDRGGPGR